MTNQHITEVLNGTLQAVTNVIPVPVTANRPTLVTAPIMQPEMGVLIGITGNVRGRLIIEGTADVFGQIGEKMYGMALEGAMLESFTGELGNMIAGNLSTNVSQKGIDIDITPPTVMVGQTKLFGFSQALQIPVTVEGVGDCQVILMLEEQ
ncbi:chemotaxis protein CheX [Effusibacillus dendaii]|uniref:CheY-P phosphatase CheX n=1 Tax=Effusibacillus dendaii TaxID=2743772 RepID=A0A7I8DAS0_9BACL|nr:chemotaxis protein CheX [Effusibacillus dendaii]BCJ87195.1 CheY-P phosphatase CheX [Effusibacillus dendaii]